MNKLVKLLISIGVSFLAGAIGSLATSPNIPSWYAHLVKPGFNPPNWVFGPVWSTLYLLMGISLYLIWTNRRRKGDVSPFVWFGFQLVLNALWSIVFFGLHMPELAVVVIMTLLGSIIVTARLFWPISRAASCLLLPYIAWVSFATALNIAIANLN